MERKLLSSEIRDRIRLLEDKKAKQLSEIRQEVYDLQEELRPINLIRKGLNNMVKAPVDDNRILNTTIGIAAGFVANKIVTRRSTNPIKKLLGDVVQDGIAKIMYKKSGIVKALGQRLINRISGKQAHRSY